MTCIAAIANGRTVWMAGDSAAVDQSHYLFRVRQPKVFVNGGYLIGYTTSFRMGQLLEHVLEPPVAPRRRGELARFMATDFAEVVRRVFIDHGWAKEEAGRTRGGVFLVGTRGRLFTFDEDFHVDEPLDRFDACGSGISVARGALFATRRGGYAPDRLRTALEAAQAFTTTVRAPFHILSLERDA